MDGRLLQLATISAPERDVIEANVELAELGTGSTRGVLVQTEQSVVAKQVHRVVHVWVGVLVDHRFGVEECFVPGNTHGEITNRERCG